MGKCITIKYRKTMLTFMKDVSCVTFVNNIKIFLAKAWPADNKSQSDYEQIRTDKIKTGEIIFPDEYNTRNRFGHGTSKDEKISASGKGLDCYQGICKDAKDYPYDLVNEVVKKILEEEGIVNVLEGNVVNLPNRFKAPGEDDTEPLCATLMHSVYPKVMKNEKDVEKYILNVDNYQQGFVYETCVEGGKCRFEDLFPSTSQCLQKYTRKRLRVLDNKNSTYDTFIVPSCCQCVIPKGSS
ncbi:hypothetical protein FQR65_LT09657 [Abscondita terminalis]|nr:hypothetical protein FQR65_LT09657 [Abscondita terminalis]